MSIVTEASPGVSKVPAPAELVGEDVDDAGFSDDRIDGDREGLLLDAEQRERVVGALDQDARPRLISCCCRLAISFW